VHLVGMSEVDKRLVARRATLGPARRDTPGDVPLPLLFLNARHGARCRSLEMRSQEQCSVAPLNGLQSALASVSSSLFSAKQPKRCVRTAGSTIFVHHCACRAPEPPLASSRRSMLMNASRGAPARVSMRAPFAAIIPGDSVVETVVTSGLDSFL
jgi:hypothetical protein